MSRYIDADKLKSEFDYKHIGMNKTTACVHHKNILEIINQQPTADVVEVVRCKDCKHNYRRTTLNHGERDNPSCKYTNYVRDNDFYCSYGERAEG